MIVLLRRLPTIGTSPHKNVLGIKSAACGSWTAITKIPVNAVLISEIVVCAPIAVAKL